MRQAGTKKKSGGVPPHSKRGGLLPPSAHIYNRSMNPPIPSILFALFLFPAASITGADGPTATIQTSDGQSHAGRVVGDAASGFRFVGDKGGPTLPLDRAGVVSFEGATALPQSPPPFQVALGHQQWVSGRLSLVS